MLPLSFVFLLSCWSPTVFAHKDKINDNLPWPLRLPDTDLPRDQHYSYQPSFFRISPQADHNFRTHLLHSLWGLTSHNKKRLKEAKQFGKVTRPYEGEFPCDLSFARSPSPPDDVNKVRPGDIDIVGAIGDSILAGNGIVSTNPTQVSTENRGLSWGAGGQLDWRTYLTLPNMLKMFNPKLFGYSLGDSFSTHRNSQFNVAELGAMSRDLWTMAIELTKRIKNDPRTDLKNHWKIITIMIGSNDFCSEFCYTELDKVVDRHRLDLIKALSYLQQELPRTIVNLAIQPNLEMLTSGSYPVACNYLHRVLCTCLFSDRFKHLQKIYQKKMDEWQTVEEEVSKLPQFRTKDFAVIPQSFCKGMKLPRISPKSNMVDMTFLGADCFHPSQRLQHYAGLAVWDNMLEPLGNKTEGVPLTQLKIKCPTESSPYIFTWDNS